MTSLHLAVSGRLPEPDVIAVLIRAGFAPNLARWVHSQLEAGPYTHYTVSQQRRGAQTILGIDTFLLDPWVDSKTGDTGESPHGSCNEYVLDTDGNVANDGTTIDADGTETHWTSRSISFFQ
jgi:hypothetical protein